MQTRLIVFAKEPRPGHSKTRLAASIGDERAASLARAMLLDTLETARSTGADVTVAFDPPSAREWFEQQAPGVTLWPQPDAPFGERLIAGVRAAIDAGAEHWVMIGMDTPHLTGEAIGQAFQSLEHSDVCIGPAEDGGYYLIGARGHHPALFQGIPWSTDAVLEATLDACRGQGLSAARLAPEVDVDDLAALARLREVLKGQAGLAPRTRDWLDAQFPAGPPDRALERP